MLAVSLPKNALLKFPKLFLKFPKLFLKFPKLFLQFLKLFLKFPKLFLQFLKLFQKFSKLFLKFPKLFLKFPKLFLKFLKLFLKFPKLFLKFLKLFLKFPKLFLKFLKLFLKFPKLFLIIPKRRRPRWSRSTRGVPQEIPKISIQRRLSSSRETRQAAACSSTQLVELIVLDRGPWNFPLNERVHTHTHCKRLVQAREGKGEAKRNVVPPV